MSSYERYNDPKLWERAKGLASQFLDITEEQLMTTNMVDYFDKLTTHEDAKVRAAAEKCKAMYGTPQWKSRTMRKYLVNLSWALYEHTKGNLKKGKIIE